MNTTLVTTAILMAFCMTASSGYCDTKKGEKIDGKREFGEHCAVCHPNGGNIVNARKTLHATSLKANGIHSKKDIIARMRNPGPGMTTFDVKTVSNKEAEAIAEYILKTYK